MFPVSVVDNFFDDPDEIIEIAQSFDYQPDSVGAWPGKRSGLLHELHPGLFNYVGNKIVSLFYETDKQHIFWNARAMFQKVEPTNNYGWVHYDDNLMTAIIYLNRGELLSAGTCVCKPKKGVVQYSISEQTEKVKRDLYLNKISQQEAEDVHRELNSQFEDTIVVKNLFNRMVLFNGANWHRADTFSALSEDRLTLVYFFENIQTPLKPIDRMRIVR